MSERQMTRDDMEKRRFKAEALLRAGASQADVSAKLGVSRTTTSRWRRRMESAIGMRKRRATGRPAMLTPLDLRKVFRQRSEWIGKSFAAALYAETGVRYDEDHCMRLLRRLRGPKTRKAAR